MTNEALVYNCHIDWDWIKQRPQFLAENLTEYYDVYVHYRKQYKRGNLHKKEKALINQQQVMLQPFRTLPALSNKYWALTSLNLKIQKRKLYKLLQRTKAQKLWLTYPSQIYEVPEKYRGMVIYDCMDDQLQLGCPRAWKSRIVEAERKMVNRSDIILASSNHLVSLLCERYPDNRKKIRLVRNACTEEFAESEPVRLPEKKGTVIAGYVGTIASWFDFQSVIESLKLFPNLQYNLIGPIGCSSPPRHDRIHYLGIVPHNRLRNYVEDFDFLVMPFIQNEIVEAVDPVKLYEYISFGRNIICTNYPEVCYFQGFVKTYHNCNEYCALIHESMYKNNPIYSKSQSKTFLSQNTWKCRAEEIYQIVEGVKN